MLRLKRTIAYFTTVFTGLLLFNVQAFATVGFSESTPNDSACIATVIPTDFDLNQEISGSIESAGDCDYYKFVPLNTGGYSIETLGTTDTFGILYNSAMNVLDASDDQTYPSGRNFELRYELAAYRTYYIKVSHKTANDTGDYKLKITPITSKYKEIESNNSFDKATALSSPFGTYPAEIGKAGDEDYFKLTPAVNSTYTFETTGDTDTFGSLYDQNHSLIASDDNSGEGNNTKIASYLAANQTYYVKINHVLPVATGQYNLKVTKAEPVSSSDFDGNDFSSAKDLTTDKNYLTYSGSGINSLGDVDTFKFTPNVDGIYTFKSTGTTDVYGEVYDSSKTLLKSDDNSSTDGNFEIAVPLNAKQTYYLKVTGANGVTGNFGLDIAKGNRLNVPQYLQLPYDELCWATSSAMATSYFNHDKIDRTLDIAKKLAKEYVSSKETYGDNYYMYPSVFNKPAHLGDCDFSNILPDVASKLKINVFADTSADPRQATGHSYSDDQLVKSIDAGYPIVSLIQNSKGGGHCIIVTGYKEDANGFNYIYNDPMDGQEHISTSVYPYGYITFFPYDVELEPNSTPREAISMDRTINATIGKPGDVDCFKIGYANGPTHKCVIETTGDTDTYGELYDKDENLIASADNGGNGGNFKIEFEAKPYQSYFVKVRHSNSTGTGSYTLNYTTDTDNLK